jgi:hypothetical protein
MATGTAESLAKAMASPVFACLHTKQITDVTCIEGEVKGENSSSFIIIIIIMFMKGLACFLFLNPQDEVGPSISSSVILCSFVLLVYIVVLVLVFYFCPPSVGVVARKLW